MSPRLRLTASLAGLALVAELEVALHQVVVTCVEVRVAEQVVAANRRQLRIFGIRTAAHDRDGCPAVDLLQPTREALIASEKVNRVVVALALAASAGLTTTLTRREDPRGKKMAVSDAGETARRGGG